MLGDHGIQAESRVVSAYARGHEVGYCAAYIHTFFSHFACVIVTALVGDCVLQPVGFVTFRSHAAAEAAKNDLQVCIQFIYFMILQHEWHEWPIMC